MDRPRSRSASPSFIFSFILYYTLCSLLVLLFSHTPQAEGTVVVNGVGSVHKNLFSSWSVGYSFNTENFVINYNAADNTTASLARVESGAIDYLITDGRIEPANLPADALQVPVTGSALVMAINLSGITNVSSLVVSSEVLAKVWMGTITTWDHADIAALNPNVTLPANAITLVVSEAPSSVEMGGVLVRALSAVSSSFAAAFASAGSLAAMVPASAMKVSGTDARLATVKANLYSMTYADYGSVLAAGMACARMKNAAGRLVSPSSAAIQSAMTDFSSSVKGDMSSDISNGAGNATWPLAYTVFLTALQTKQAKDCGPAEGLMRFLSWAQTNDRAGTTINAQGWGALAIVYKRALINSFGTVKCNNETALSTAYIIGMGGTIRAVDDWAVAYTSNSFVEKYYVYDSPTTINQMIAGSIDFGAVSYEPTEAQWAQLPDVLLVPLLGQAGLASYNILELLESDPLVLTLEILSDIYLGKIANWRDPKILNINQPIASLIPNQSIIVVVPTIFSAINVVNSAAMAKAVPEFASQVTPGGLVTYPVQTLAPERVKGVPSSANVQVTVAAATPYAIWLALSGMIDPYNNLRAASLYNPAGNVVAPGPETILSLLNDFAGTTDFVLLLGTGANSWPMASYNGLLINQIEPSNCAKAKALVDWIYWTQSTDEASTIATRNRITSAGRSPGVLKRILTQLTSVTCQGTKVSSIAPCVRDGELCSGHGSCPSGECVCASGWSGTFCDDQAGSSSDNTATIALAVGLGVGVPFFLIVVIVAAVAIVMAVIVKKRQWGNDNWEISPSELEMEDHLGTGGYGSVYKAKWRGTEVAVKVMSSEVVTKEMQRQFADEVRMMTALRHPNVVLFMAACTKPPKMCIVMEHMSLGSLYELLHNELIPDIPLELKVKMAYQAAKGMHFLHSSGIVHRDLKSLNLLLDAKWNVKVSDFGLTKFREEVQKATVHEAQGSIHWTAPEVLNETVDLDYTLADVYSFGIIMWELMTREQPYSGMGTAAVAVAVIRDNLRPSIPDNLEMPHEYSELMTGCWHSDPAIRPTFLEVMTRLSAIAGEHTSMGGTSMTTTSSGISMSGGSTSAGTGSVSSSSASSVVGLAPAINGNGNGGSSGVAPPEGEMAVVFTDITRAASLWEHDPAAMRDATMLHNDILRSLLKKHRGYEALFARGSHHNSGEGSFCMAFQEAGNAVEWCMEAQQALLKAEWPRRLLEHPGAGEEWGDTDDRVLFRGLRVRMGIHVGSPRSKRDPTTRRVEYSGPAIDIAARITALTHGGQILVSGPAFAKLKSEKVLRFARVGRFDVTGSPSGEELHELKTRGLEARFFGGVADDRSSSRLSASFNSNDGNESRGSLDQHELQAHVGEGMEFKEDTFLTSANMVRWVVDFKEIALGRQVGMGSYGVVHRGQWKGVEVAVKRFIKQKLDERRMLEFRAEIAFLSELHHPNVVLFIGACIKSPNLCIVTEFVKQGSLKDILTNTSVKLPWTRRLELLRSAALGINYLHTLEPMIVHRDLKPSNLLVDESWNVKVADFGFARIKEDNATMTRCGTPCWTAPEVIRGEKYGEKADVYSFGIIMWEVLTRKQPFAGRNFMGVSLDVLEGKRPQVPGDCAADFKKLMKKCWHATASKRPAMEGVLSRLDDILQNAHASGPTPRPVNDNEIV